MNLNPNSEQPKVSFVATSRNDDYGGNLVSRMNAFATVLGQLADHYQFLTELVLVDYNQPTNERPFREILKIPTSPYLTVHFVEVPAKFHQRFPKSERIPMFEYFGKNIGIRRARGEWIVSTNPDIIFSQKLFALIANNQLDKNCFYRADRHDLNVDHMEPDLDLAKTERFCRKHTYRVFAAQGLHYTSLRRWFFRFHKSPRLHNLLLAPFVPQFMNLQAREPFHVGAPGDFLLMHRDQWSRVSGYEQQQGGGAYIDGLMLYYLDCFGIKEKRLTAPIWHIKHVVARLGRANMEDGYYRELVRKMLTTRVPYRTPSADWGFPEENFFEITVT